MQLTSIRTQAGGLTFHARVARRPGGPAVVLVHGIVVSSRYMIPVANELAGFASVWAPDLPGFGRSSRPRRVLDVPELADALAAWMAEVGLDRAALVGNSLGCQILAEFALRHGGRVACLVLQGPTADPAARTYRQQIARQLSDSRYDGWPRMTWIMLTDYAAAGPRRLAEALREQGDPTQPRAIVLGEENKIRQVVTNLMGNAQRYSPAGSPIELGVGVDLRRKMGVIAIIDHGRGIPPQMRDKIFQRFWRADTSRTRETGGSGLGLAIVAAIVASHGGMIEVDETPGGGATFRVLLPLAPSFADRTPEDEVDEVD